MKDLQSIRVDNAMTFHRSNWHVMDSTNSVVCGCSTQAKADVIVDQLRCGSHGVFAVEAMATGKPVLCYIRDELVETSKQTRRDPIYPNKKDRMRMWALRGRLPRLDKWMVSLS